jgi:hypothetical protein
MFLIQLPICVIRLLLLPQLLIVRLVVFTIHLQKCVRLLLQDALL